MSDFLTWLDAELRGQRVQTARHVARERALLRARELAYQVAAEHDRVQLNPGELFGYVNADPELRGELESLVAVILDNDQEARDAVPQIEARAA